MVVELKYMHIFLVTPPFNRWNLIISLWVWAVLTDLHLMNKMWQKWQCSSEDWIINGTVVVAFLSVSLSVSHSFSLGSLAIREVRCQVMRIFLTIKGPHDKKLGLLVNIQQRIEASSHSEWAFLGQRMSILGKQILQLQWSLQMTAVLATILTLY